MELKIIKYRAVNKLGVASKETLKYSEAARIAMHICGTVEQIETPATEMPTTQWVPSFADHGGFLST